MVLFVVYQHKRVAFAATSDTAGRVRMLVERSLKEYVLGQPAGSELRAYYDGNFLLANGVRSARGTNGGKHLSQIYVDYVERRDVVDTRLLTASVDRFLESVKSAVPVGTPGGDVLTPNVPTGVRRRFAQAQGDEVIENVDAFNMEVSTHGKREPTVGVEGVT